MYIIFAVITAYTSVSSIAKGEILVTSPHKPQQLERLYARATLVDGDRVLGSNEGGIRGKTPYVLDRFDLEYIRQFDFVHSGNYCFMEKELPKIREAGVPISFDFSDDSERYIKHSAQ